MGQAQRRKFLFGAGALLAAVPLTSVAQPAQKPRRIGFLSPDSFASIAGKQARQMLPASLRRFGYEQGKNLVIEWRWSDGKTEPLYALAEELVGLKVELIVARTSYSIAAAKRATRTVPIVMLNGNFPVESGLVKSLARPGENITGTSYYSPEFVGKQLQILKEVAPRAVQVAILWESSRPRDSGFGKFFGDSAERAAASLGMNLQYFEVSRPDQVAAALDEIATRRVDALWFSGAPVFRERMNEIVTFLRKRKLVSVGAVPLFAENGGLLDYAPDSESFFDRTASYVDRILKGAQPGDLPVEQPTKFNLVINLKTAKALGLTMPRSLLLRADRVIE